MMYREMGNPQEIQMVGARGLQDFLRLVQCNWADRSGIRDNGCITVSKIEIFCEG